jgi:hypothetical protein
VARGANQPPDILELDIFDIFDIERRFRGIAQRGRD